MNESIVGRFSEPLSGRRSRAPYQQAFTIDPRALLLAETVMPDKWFRPLNEPVRQKRRVREFMAFPAIDPWILTQKEAVSFASWWQPFGYRLRGKRGLPAQYQFQYFPTMISGSGICAGIDGDALVLTVDALVDSLPVWGGIDDTLAAKVPPLEDGPIVVYEPRCPCP